MQPLEDSNQLIGDNLYLLGKAVANQFSGKPDLTPTIVKILKTSPEQRGQLNRGPQFPLTILSHFFCL